MTTTRRRVNLTLTDAEERALTSLATADTPQRAALASHYTTMRPSTDIDAELVHLVLDIGLKRLEMEAIEASYAAEAAAYTDEDRALTAARRRRLAAVADRDNV